MSRLQLRARWRRNPMWGDAFVMLLLSPYTLMMANDRWDEEILAGRLPGPLLLLWSLLYTVPLLWRRSRPEWMAAGLLAAHVIQLFLMPMMLPANVVVPVAVYALARYLDARRSRFWLVVVLVGALVAGVQWGLNSGGTFATAGWTGKLAVILFWFVGCSAMTLMAWFWGLWNRQKDLTHQSWRERAEALERERAQGMALVAQEERNRLAREMHDIVAHSLSVIVVQADGAGYLAGHDELGDAEARLAQVNKAIETIGQTARTALGETRRLVGVLRHDGEELEMAPAATVDQIGDLVAQLQAAGVPASFRVEGSPDDHPPLGEGAEMAIYRVAQESLTNVMKHAGAGATVGVTLSHSSEGVGLRVADTGSGPGETDGMGHGLVGMRERMAAWGGQLNAGPRRGGGFEVYATLPAEPAPAAPRTPTNREDSYPTASQTKHPPHAPKLIPASTSVERTTP